jgi:hypothetical protein
MMEGNSADDFSASLAMGDGAVYGFPGNIVE